MRSRVWSILLVGGCLLVAAAAARAEGGEVVNLRALHNPDSPQVDWDCLKCHGDVMERETLDPAILSAHPLKVRVLAELAYYPAEPVVTSELCLFCHWGVDFDEFSVADVRRNVEVEFCAICHDSSASPVLPSFYVR
jgi:hypothetical protein